MEAYTQYNRSRSSLHNLIIHIINTSPHLYSDLNQEEEEDMETENERKNKTENGGNFSGSVLEWDSSDDYLVVQCSKSSPKEGSHPENPLKGTTKKKKSVQSIFTDKWSFLSQNNIFKIKKNINLVWI